MISEEIEKRIKKILKNKDVKISIVLFVISFLFIITGIITLIIFVVSVTNTNYFNFNPVIEYNKTLCKIKKISECRYEDQKTKKLNYKFICCSVYVSTNNSNYINFLPECCYSKKSNKYNCNNLIIGESFECYVPIKEFKYKWATNLKNIYSRNDFNLGLMDSIGITLLLFPIFVGFIFGLTSTGFLFFMCFKIGLEYYVIKINNYKQI
jgi:hypothetical protein